MALRLLLIRHAQTVWNRDRRYQGWQDSPLSEVGRAQAEAVGRALSSEPLKAVYSSTLGRARETAEAIAAFHGLPVHADDAFREMAFGDWEGLAFDDCKAKDPDRYRLWADEPHRFVPPGGESLKDTVARTLPYFIQEILPAVLNGKRTIVSAHGNSLRALIMAIEGLTPEQILKRELDTGVPVVYRLKADSRPDTVEILS